MKLEITNTDVYETKVYTIEEKNGNGYIVTISYKDFFEKDIHIVDFDNNEIFPNDEIYDELIILIEESE